MMKRVFHPYHKWEDFLNGMWRTVEGVMREEYLEKAVHFTGAATLYGSYMMRVVFEWPIATEHNLTCISMNRQAWVGHAATCLAIQCPEDITRLAWHRLTQLQQDEANHQADLAIAAWEREYKKERRQLCLSGI